MHPGLNKNERELVRLTKYFIKQAEQLVQDKKLNTEQSSKIVGSCQMLQQSLDTHATYRERVMQNREKLAKSVKDNASCPQCKSGSQIKITGVALHEQGWKSNKYKCRKCNITFTWNRPNNPWDMVVFIENIIADTNSKLKNAELPDIEKQLYENTLKQMEANLQMVKPVIDNSDAEFKEMEAREKEMAQTVHEFKKYLMIEKIRMDVLPEN